MLTLHLHPPSETSTRRSTAYQQRISKVPPRKAADPIPQAQHQLSDNVLIQRKSDADRRCREWPQRHLDQRRRLSDSYRVCLGRHEAESTRKPPRARSEVIYNRKRFAKGHSQHFKQHTKRGARPNHPGKPQQSIIARHHRPHHRTNSDSLRRHDTPVQRFRRQRLDG